MKIASHVRGDIGVRRTALASSAVTSGATASMISVFAVDVRVNASMKLTNMIDHMQPDISPATPARRNAPEKSRCSSR